MISPISRIPVTRILMGLLFLTARPAFGQDLKEAQESPASDSSGSPIFGDIQAGLRGGDVNKFSGHLAKEVYLNFPGRESGYFSENQALYILKEYFNSRHILSFKFSTISEIDSAPFATGGGMCLRRGSSELLQVYVALKKSGDRWVIAQFSVF